MAAEARVEDFTVLERMYAERPAAYRRRVFGLVCLGYAYIGFCLLVIAGFVAGGAAAFATGKVRVIFLDDFLKIAVPAVVVAGMMLRAFFVRIPPPEGIYLEGALKQKVLDFVAPVRKVAGGRPVDEVVIVNELNAAVQQQPRFGFVGPTTNYLILGAPLLQLLSSAELKAVIAHEFGHLSHAHGRMGATVYRLDHTLRSAAQAIQEKARSGLAKLSFRFFDWFYPKFDTVTFAMRRGQEYEADRVAARATSAAANASALCRIHALDRCWGQFWGGIWQRARTLQTNTGVFPQRELRSQVASLVDARSVSASVEAALSEQTGYTDTHPCLRDRLAALGESPVTSFPDRGGAISEIFDEAECNRLYELVDADWQKSSGEHWQGRHESYRSADATIEALRARRAELSGEELLRLARMEEDLDGQDAAFGTYRELVERFPDYADAHFHWARVQIERDLDAAEAALVACLERDIEFTPDAQRLLHYGYDAARRDGESPHLAPFLERYNQIAERANAERESATSDDRFAAHRVGDNRLAPLRERLRGHPEILKAFLVEKTVDHLKYRPVYVLGLEIDSYHGKVGVNQGKWLTQRVDEFAGTLPQPSTLFAVVLNAKSPWNPVFARFDNAPIHAADRTRIQRARAWVRRAYAVLFLVGVVVLVGFILYRCAVA